MRAFDQIAADSILGEYTRFVSFIFSLTTFAGLFFIHKGLVRIIKQGIFNNAGAVQFNIAGRILLIAGLFSIIFDMALVVYSKGESSVSPLLLDFVLATVGFSLIIIAEIIKKGRILKQDNELTSAWVGNRRFL